MEGQRSLRFKVHEVRWTATGEQFNPLNRVIPNLHSAGGQGRDRTSVALMMPFSNAQHTACIVSTNVRGDPYAS
jgi:hypothetical protein